MTTGTDNRVSVHLDPRDRRRLRVARITGAVVGWAIIFVTAWLVFR